MQGFALLTLHDRQLFLAGLSLRR